MKSKKPFQHRMGILLLMWLSIALPSFGQNPAPVNGLVAHYPLKSKLWNTTSSGTSERYMELNAYDVSGNAYHGTYNASSSLWTYGSFIGELTPFNEAAFTTNGYSIPCTEKTTQDNAYLSLPDLGLTPTNGFSIAFWIYWSPSDTRNENIISTRYLRIDRNGSNIRLYSVGVATYQDFPVYSGEGWYYVAVTYSGTSASVYQYKLAAPGFVLTPTVKTLSLSDGDFGYGIFGNKNNYLPFKGKLCQVKFYNRPLASTEIQDNCNTDLQWVQKQYSNKHYPFSGVYSFYPFNQGTDIYKDLGKAGNNGNAVGSITSTQSYDGTNNAIQLSGSGTRFSTGHFFGNTYDATQGFAFSFWTKIDEANAPFTTTNPATAANKKMIFYVHRIDSNTTILGMQRINELLSSFRYSPNSSTAWNLWYDEPISFTNQAGWYQVTFSVHPTYSEIFIKKPTPDPLTGERFNYFYTYFGSGDQAWLNTLRTSLRCGIGSPGGSTPIDKVDDFRVYNWPLDLQEIEALSNGTSEQNAATLAATTLTTTAVMQGVTKQSGTFDNFFGGKQQLNMLDLDLSDAVVDMKINYYMPFYYPDYPSTFDYCLDYVTGLKQLKPTSHLAAQAGAMAAVNGTFFSWYKSDLKGWQQYVKKDGSVIWTPDIKSQKNEGALAFDFSRSAAADKVKFFPRDQDNLNIYTQSSSLPNQYLNVISGGHYMQNGQSYYLKQPSSCSSLSIPSGDCSFDPSGYSSNLNCTTTDYNYMSCVDYCRAPLFLEDQNSRTFIGRKGTHLYLGTFNGEGSLPTAAAGLSIYNMNTFKDIYELDDYLTFDGGSSSTMWINGQNGVVVGNGFDYPANQAPVANALLVMPKLQTSQIPTQVATTSTKVMKLDGTNFIDLSKYYNQMESFQDNMIMGRFKITTPPATGQEYTLFSVSNDTIIADYEYVKLSIAKQGSEYKLRWTVKEAGRILCDKYFNGPSINIVDGNWHSFAVVMDEEGFDETLSKRQLYLDYASVFFIYDNLPASYYRDNNISMTVIRNTHAHVGTRVSAGNFVDNFNGFLDEIVLYTDLSYLKNALNARFGNNAPYSNLVDYYRNNNGILPRGLLPADSHYWQFEETAGYHAIDVAGELNRGSTTLGQAGFHGLLVNNPLRILKSASLLEEEVTSRSDSSSNIISKVELQPERLRIYPNPSDGTFTVEFRLEEASDIEIKLYDLLGRVIYTEKSKATRGEQRLNLEKLTAKGVNSGTYIIQLSTLKWVAEQKIVIK